MSSKKSQRFIGTKSMSVYTIGYSPCPNDTYIFGGLATGAIQPDGFALKVELHDVETLNNMALDHRLDISKLSFYAWLRVKAHYHLLKCGAALGYGCGPIVVARHPMTQKEVANSRIVLPGPLTTAHLLFRLWVPEAQDRIFVPYDQIFAMLNSGKADCGVIIHESRFTYQQAGFKLLADLGEFWEQETQMPIPLGCIAVKKEVGDQIISKIERAIQNSIRFARNAYQDILPYIKEHAQELDADVLQRHIDTFVNEFSWNLGPIGRKAVRTLEQKSKAAGVLP
jgi:1,4-dihydroxy-6-naphthoate synthase